MCHQSPSQQLQVDAATLQLCLQLFAQSGLEKPAFADMETLSNHMGLFLQVSYTSHNVLYHTAFRLCNARISGNEPACQLNQLQEQLVLSASSLPHLDQAGQSFCSAVIVVYYPTYLNIMATWPVCRQHNSSAVLCNRHVCLDRPYAYAGLQFSCWVCMHC